ncbi:HAD family hydrolase [Pelagerythrobacter rhizovicinus]|uniref:HAD family hydrolase n=1 Tax=Pelagerythrobacter rhizovicinus TaxID=2268576 RepID=A0A4Q2KKK5_9SPHN|nr:HAD family hydrolase [Pelagerythrobacter rhizovicinus]RXZ64897.1 HAD family hydrolase [Pelagerythrobacter rhizovicinus]
MSRPLIISDCDEVLLHMVAHFRDWLGESEGVDFTIGSNSFAEAMRWRESGEVVGERDMWRLLGRFFDTEMDRQRPIEGAVAGVTALAEHADVVILTNLNDERQERRARQLADHGIAARVFTNQGPKGPALKAIVEEYAPSRAIFIDDLPQHHHSAAETVPEVVRLHLCGEPQLAPHIDCAHRAGHAHARIDTWCEALPWLMDQLNLETQDREHA